MRPLPPRAAMERAFLAGDATFDPVFVAGVRTTGIVCRPSCPARKPLPHHLQFFGTVSEALEAGYRPCLRCRPLDDERAPVWLARLVDRIAQNQDRPLNGGELRALGVEPARARRAFTRHFGMTLTEYARAQRVGRALDRLQAGATLDEVVFESGFESHSGFRDAFTRLAGCPPGRAHRLTRVALAWFDTPLGRMVAGATGLGVCLLEFADPPRLEAQLTTLRRRLDAVTLPGVHPHLDRLRDELQEYFAGARRVFSVPLVMRGTPFEERVWQEVRRIPYGETGSYRQVARAIGRPDAQRAVGRANGLNRVAILIPCHRVVGAGGALVGYGGGLWRKRLLLHLERTGEPLTVNAQDALRRNAHDASRS